MLKRAVGVLAVTMLAAGAAVAGQLAQATVRTQSTGNGRGPITDTPVDTVSGFYDALRRGDGKAA